MHIRVLCTLLISIFIAAIQAHAQTTAPLNGQFTQEGYGLKRALPNSAPVKAASDWSFNFWVRPAAAIQDQTLLAGFGDAKNFARQQRYLAYFNDGLRFWGSSVDIRTGATLELDKWQMLSAVYQSGVLTAYKDGIERVSQPVALADAAREINLAPVSPWAAGGHFEGKIGAFELYDRALTKEEIRALLARNTEFETLTFETGAPETWKLQSAPGQSGKVNQTPESLPKSRVPLGQPAKPFPAMQQRLVANRDGDLIIAGPWQMLEAPKMSASGEVISRADFNTAGWYQATVPGTALSTLVNQGLFPDPLHGLNNLAIPESLNKQDYWYRVAFETPKNFAGRRVTLNFKGINYHAQIWLNGKPLGNITGAFIRGKFEVGDSLRPNGPNVLAVRISPPPNPGIPHEESLTAGAGPNGGSMVGDGPTFFSSEGWDWIPGIRDRNSGIWREVVLHASDAVALEDPQVVTRLQDKGANVQVSVIATNASNKAQEGILRGSFEGVSFQKRVVIPAGERQTISFTPAEFRQLFVSQPRLWWPNGYGKPDLYQLRLDFVNSAGKTSDFKLVRFGIREISVEISAARKNGKVGRYEFFPTVTGEKPVLDVRHEGLVNSSRGWMPSVLPEAESSAALKPIPDSEVGSALVIKVNGQRIALKGGNWGMDDAMKRVSRERLEPYIRLERDAHFNVIRNWCGQSTSEEFFELCDEYGMLVWNDFWLTTQNYNQEPRDSALLLENARDSIIRFRNHPSIAIWCGRNEGVPPPAINEGLDRLVRQYDGTRYYHPNSMIINLRGSGPWNYNSPTRYFTDFKGFTTELGLPNPPSADTIRDMMPEADRWPISDNWAYHDWHQAAAGNVKPFMDAMTTQFGAPTGLEDFVRKSQMLNYVAHRAMFEGFNASLWKPSSGRFMWMSHPSWPSTSWQLYSSNCEATGGYFGVQKACEPVHVQLNLASNIVNVVNNTLTPLEKLTVRAEVYNLDGTLISASDAGVDVPANSVANSLQLKSEAPVYFVKLVLRDSRGQLLSDNFYWLASTEANYQALNQLPQVKLDIRSSIQQTKENAKVTVEILNPTKSVALMTELALRDKNTGQRILPAYASDNYLSLLPGEKRIVTISFTPKEGQKTVSLSVQGWNLTPITSAVQ